MKRDKEACFNFFPGRYTLGLMGISSRLDSSYWRLWPFLLPTSSYESCPYDLILFQCKLCIFQKIKNRVYSMNEVLKLPPCRSFLSHFFFHCCTMVCYIWYKGDDYYILSTQYLNLVDPQRHPFHFFSVYRTSIPRFHDLFYSKKTSA